MLKLVGLCATAGVLVAAVAFPVVGGLGLLSNQTIEAVDQVSNELVKADPPLMTTIADRHGTPVAYLYDQERVLVPGDQISPFMKQALVAVEDRRFYEHNGIDSTGTFRAVLKNVVSKDTEGGSTLTQQYVKNYLAHVVPKNEGEHKEALARATAPTLNRKLKEARIAVELEAQLKAAHAGKPDGARLAKDEILTRYLNVVPFGGFMYGISTAARGWFNKPASALDEVESAFLAGLVNQPGLNPEKDPEKVKRRRDKVLDDMAKAGVFDPDAEKGKLKATALKDRPVPSRRPAPRPQGCVAAENGVVNGFFCAYVIDYLGKLGFKLEQLKRGGYTIKTTLDQVATKQAKEAAEDQVPKTHEGIANVMAVVEPGPNKHPVRALVANRDFGLKPELGQRNSPLPTTITRFGAGSIFKIFTAAAALQKGTTGVHRMVQVPKTYESKLYKYSISGKNDDFEQPLQDALAQSPNTAFVKLQEETGLDNVVDMAVKLGLRDSLQAVNRFGVRPDPANKDKEARVSQERYVKDFKIGAFTLGVSPVSVLELANVGATLQSSGTWCPPSPIEQVLDRNGQPVDLKEPGCERVIESDLADAMIVGLSRDTDRSIDGTAATAATAANWTRPMLGKTGTTNDHQSAGFVGATPNFSGAVLTFSDSPTPKEICDGDPPSLCGKGRGNIYGGKIPARTWFNAMKPIHGNAPTKSLPELPQRYAQ